MIKLVTALLFLFLAWPFSLAFGVTVKQFVPQGAVDQQSMVSVEFSAEMVKKDGDLAFPPFVAHCGAVGGKGRWESARTWVWQMQRPLHSGERCDFELHPNLTALNGERVTGEKHFSFFVSGLWPRSILPIPETTVDENQIFLISVGGGLLPSAASVEKSLWCEADGVGNRIPVRVTPEAERRELLAKVHARVGPEPLLAVSCAERLPPGAKMKLVWGKGIQVENGVQSKTEEEFIYTVREPFRANLTCEREKAGAACSPLSSVRVEFTAPVDAKALRQARLLTPAGARLPQDPARNGDDESSRNIMAEAIVFPGPLPVETEMTLELPAGLQDDAGRSLVNGDRFPLKFRSGPLPPLAKFPGDFGIVELNEGGLLPVTLRNVEPQLTTATLQLPGNHHFSDQHLNDDQGVIAAITELAAFENQSKTVEIERDGKKEEVEDYWYPRELSFLKNRPGVVRQELPKPGGSAEFEVVGIPLTKPGYHLVEIESRLLGTALLASPKPMFVRAAVLVTNLAVHLKLGKDNSLVWVTELESGKPVVKAEVRVSGCDGKEQWRGTTDEVGRAFIDQPLTLPPCRNGSFLLASARRGEDYSFVRSDWTEGIEPWRFGVETWGEAQDFKIHTIFDRPLFRPGQTVSMKHIARVRDSKGFAFPLPASLPTTATIRHSEGAEFSQPLLWDAQGSAVSSWQIPAAARRGSYTVRLTGNGYDDDSGEFRVSDFRVPVFTGSIQGTTSPQVASAEIPLLMGLSFLNGGAAKGTPVSISATLRPRWPHFARYENYSFIVEFRSEEEARSAFHLEGGEEQERLALDKQSLTLDENGGGKLAAPLPQKPQGPSELYTEMSFMDPNGETQTIRGTVDLWPAAVALGLKVNEEWMGKEGENPVQVVALDLQGKPVAGQVVQVVAQRRIDYGHRRRIVGGFYAYENHAEFEEMGTVCQGKTDDNGLFSCKPDSLHAGHFYLLAVSRDDKGNTARAGVSYWASGAGDSWFSSGNVERMDIVLDKPSYRAGETARVQVRTPFREAMALITVEAGGILDSLVQPLSRSQPVIELPVKENWGPNAFVSVLLVRGRIHPLSWSSLAQWGWKEPGNWRKEWQNPPQATAMVDLAKPAFRLGLTEIAVGTEGFRLQVEVAADQAEYQPRAEATVSFKVTTPEGKPAPAGTEIAFAAVDQGLLELRPNESWNLLEAMLQHRPCEVETATAQSQVIGKRHFGKKALPVGGGGGKAPTRELFDTLLAWHPRITLDANGAASIKAPLNDSLSEFKLVGIASSGPALFGVGSTSVRTRQDLQMISGLPPLVREKDRFQALLTLRNSTTRAMSVTVGARAAGRSLPEKLVSLPAEGATEISWEATAPEDAPSMEWEFTARENGGAEAADRLKITQKVDPAVPVTVRQASFLRIARQAEVPLALPSGGLPGKGGVEIGLSPQLSTPPPGLRRFFSEYPFSCLEQKASVAVGLGDEKRWQALLADLPVYLDADGLARYFPGLEAGDVVLTAYLLDLSALSGFSLPAEIKERMAQGLTAFVEGRILRQSWSPTNDLLVRKLLALEALTRQGQSPTKVAAALKVEPLRLVTSALIDWYLVVKRLPQLPQREKKLAAVEQELRNRLSYSGTRLVFASERSDNWWWLMVNGDSNAFRLIEAMLDNPGWRDDIPRLLVGALERQARGHWQTTTANAWATLVLQAFGRQFERESVTGVTLARLGESSAEFQWRNDNQERKDDPSPLLSSSLNLPWPPEQEGVLALDHQGVGQPWATVQSLAAVPIVTATAAGYRVSRTVTPLQERVVGKTHRGDLWRVTISVEADQDASWVVLSDPVPAGAKILGDGDGRDSRLAVSAEDRRNRRLWPSFVERNFGFFRAYYEMVPKGHFQIDYTVRINNPGEFSLPPTRVEAMYAPDIFGEAPNGKVVVEN